MAQVTQSMSRGDEWDRSDVGTASGCPAEMVVRGGEAGDDWLDQIWRTGWVLTGDGEGVDRLADINTRPRWSAVR
jgi:hypothetical protein